MQAIQGIKGFLGTSLIDYPGKVAAVVFLSGCNLRCPFCHNSILVREEEKLADLNVKELLEALQRRKKLLEGVVITGGEPTAHPHLAGLLEALRETGLQIKLDSNGMRPQVLEQVIAGRLVDYVAVDMKLAPERYFTELGGPKDAPQRLAETVGVLRASGLAYEFRTTCVPGMVGEQDLLVIARLIAGAPAYYLQQFLPVHVSEPALADRPPFPWEVLERYAELVRPLVPGVEVRNI